MKKFIVRIPTLSALFFILLFTYAAVSKILDFENFQVQLALLGTISRPLSYGIVLAELSTVFLLSYRKTQITGLAGSLLLLLLFSAYILWMMTRAAPLPCSCGGLLERMSWKQHLIFNTGCILLATASMIIKKENDRPEFA